MEISVYSVEKHDRPLKWKIWITCIGLIIILMALFGGNFVGPSKGIYITWSGFGSAVLLILLIGFYRYIHEKALKTPVRLKIMDEGLLLDKDLIIWDRMKGFDIEIDPVDNIMLNIVLLYDKKHRICSLNDTQGNIASFVDELKEKIEMTDDYKLSKAESIMRKRRL